LAVLLLGAKPLLAQWEAIGPFGGHAHRIVIDPTNPQHLYAATKRGQIYQSRDAGDRWKPLPFALTSAASLSTLVINPKNANELFVAVAQSYTPANAAGETLGDAGVYKSTDAGLHWTRLQQTAGWSVLTLAIHPTQTQIVVIGTDEGVFRSDDAGTTWRQISPKNHRHIKAVVSLALDPKNTRVLYAGTTHLPWKTSDGGATWDSIHDGMLDDSDVFSIAISSTNSNSLLLGACSGVYRTETAGARWLGKSGIPERSARTHQVLQDPVNVNTFYAATAHGLWKSVDGGRIWTQPNPYPYIVNSMAIDPKNPKTIYLATDRSGLLKSTNGGRTFAAINQGFVNRNLGRLVSEDVLYVTSVYDGDFGGLFATPDRGLTWALNGNQDALLGKNIISLAVAPQDPVQLIAGSYDGLLHSSDRGKTWKVVDTFSAETRSGRIYDVAFSRVDPGTIYVATDHGLFKTTNGGVSWQKNPAKELDSSIYKLSIDPADARTMMIHTSNGVLISRDGEGRWDPLNFGQNTVVYDFAFGAEPQRRMVAASSRGLLYSEDEGLNWNVVQGGLPAMRLDQILLVPDKPEELYVLSRDNHQMWESTNAGREWVKLDTGGLERASLRFMTVVSGQPFVVTENHGVFRLDARSDISHLLQAP
jgi:photosystem II stability/assembly factor-like uncharacterized protein